MYLVDSKSSAFVLKVSAGTIFFLLQHRNCLATSDRATLHVYFSLPVSSSIGDKFEFTNVRSYSPNSEFFDVFKQAKCPSLDFKRIFICLCLRSFDGRKTLINRLVPKAFIGSSRDHENVDGRFVIENNILLYTERNFKALKLYRIFRKFTYFYDTIANLVSQFYIIADV